MQMLNMYRNIYYQNRALFKTQGYVDELVDDVAFTFGVGRDALNIVRFIRLRGLEVYIVTYEAGCRFKGSDRWCSV
jgi:DNA topoisomerase VI subunit A